VTLAAAQVAGFYLSYLGWKPWSWETKAGESLMSTSGIGLIALCLCGFVWWSITDGDRRPRALGAVFGLTLLLIIVVALLAPAKANA
jgi:hypothetical protein